MTGLGAATGGDGGGGAVESLQAVTKAATAARTHHRRGRLVEAVAVIGDTVPECPYAYRRRRSGLAMAGAT